MDTHDPDAIVSEASFAVRRRAPEQSDLFPSDDLILPEVIAAYRKPVSALHVIPVQPGHLQDLGERRLFDALIMVAQIDCRKRGIAIERIRDERVSPLFEVRVVELARIAGIPGKNYKRLYDHLSNLYGLDMRWNILGEDGVVEFAMRSHFLSLLGYGESTKRGLIRFAFDPSILSIVLEPSRWAALSIQVMQDLKTSPAYALYQNAWKYVGTQHKVTPRLPVATWIELLLGKTGYVVESAGGEKRVERYGDFKRRVLVDALIRVNSIPALQHTLELKEFKSGKRVSKLQFSFVPKEQPSLGIPLTWPAEVAGVLESLGFAGSEIEDISQAHSYEEVREALVRLKAQETRMKAAGTPITSKKAYFGGILRNIAGGAAAEEIDHAKIEAEVRQAEAERAAVGREERLKAAFAEHQTERFTVWFLSLPDTERDHFLAGCRQDPQNAVLSSLKRPVDAGNRAALIVVRNWLVRQRPDLVEQIFPLPEDRSYEAWLAWKLDNAAAAA